MSTQFETRRHSWSGLAGLAIAAAATLGAASTTATAAPITYTMTWGGVSGTLNGTAFSNETMVIRFSADTTNIQTGALFQDAAHVEFGNGAGITVSLGSLLNNESLASIAGNTSYVYMVSGNISFARALAGGGFRAGLESVQNIPNPPGLPNEAARNTWRLSNDWNGAATGVIFGGANWPLQMATSGALIVNPGVTTTGYWGIAPSAVPGAGLAGLASLGLAGLARRRRR